MAVLGAGSWGTALALHCCRLGHDTTLWSRTAAHRFELDRDRENQRYLPGFRFPTGLHLTADLATAVAESELLICAIPSHGLRGILTQVAGCVGSDHIPPHYLIAAKGVEVETLMTMVEVAGAELPVSHLANVAVLGGPSFAAEVAAGKPCAVVVAAECREVAERTQIDISGGGLRAYAGDDVIGVELGGAFKNVIALAAGINDGAGLGLNSRAALITRGLAEISRLALVLGAKPATLAGLAGLGDLILTCTGGPSRNHRVGVALGEGRALDEILGSMGMVAEGVRNTLSAHKLAQREGVEMPIVATMYEILYGGRSVTWAIDALMQRALKHELQ